MKPAQWIGRHFAFGQMAGLHVEMIERLRGTPARLEDRLSSLSRDVRTRRPGERWTIQEEAGHLLDLEPLVARRVQEFLDGVATLHAADMTNKATFDAHHNDRPLSEILAGFRAARGQTISRLEGLEPADFDRSAVHPRLNRSLTLTDMLYFQAEHDDHHLARISELLGIFAI